MDDFSPDNRRGTGFTNLQQYLNANQNNNLDNYIGGQIQNEGQNFQNNVNSSQQDFANQMGTQNQDLQNEQSDIQKTLSPYQVNNNDSQRSSSSVSNPVDTSTQTGGGSASGLATPAISVQQAPDMSYADAWKKYGPTDQQTQNFQNYIKPIYSGPSGLSNYDALRSQSQNLQDARQQAQSADPSSLLGRYLGNNGQYTSGEQTFDRLFLGNGAGIRQGLNSLSNINPNAIDNLNIGDQSNVAGYKAQQQATANNLRQQLGIDGNGIPLQNTSLTNQASTVQPGLLQQYTVPLQNQVTAAQQAQQNTYNNDLNAFNSGDPSKYTSILQGFGATPLSDASLADPTVQAVNPNTSLQLATPGQSQSSYWGVTPSASYLTMGPQATTDTVATPDQEAKINAIEKLAGLTPTVFNTSVAGTYDTANNGLKFNNTDFGKLVNSNRNDYLNKFQPQLANLQFDYSNLGSNVAGLRGDTSTIAKTQQDVANINALRAMYGLPAVTAVGQNTTPVNNTSPNLNGALTGAPGTTVMTPNPNNNPSTSTTLL